MHLLFKILQTILIITKVNRRGVIHQCKYNPFTSWLQKAIGKQVFKVQILLKIFSVTLLLYHPLGHDDSSLYTDLEHLKDHRHDHTIRGDCLYTHSVLCVMGSRGWLSRSLDRIHHHVK